MKTITLKISGLHCVSCCLNIDGELENTGGVFESNTYYAKSETRVSYDEEKISLEKIQAIINKLGYKSNLIA
jgi:Cu+-exporting ATPase